MVQILAEQVGASVGVVKLARLLLADGFLRGLLDKSQYMF
jgi:hypothetical protein